MVLLRRSGETGRRIETSTTGVAMKTVVTSTRLRPGGEEEWDTAMRERFDSARGRPGWISGQLLTPEDERDARTIVGTWRSREDWKAWHDDPAFLEQRTVLERLEAEPNRTQWFDVIADARADT
jgi:heme-degrading monooxygenase HmoA